ncbi:ABC transporter permease [Oricola cellulosilytica]|uniref:ABC transporter permease n=1 Tax=Oricola cellulosilytica TaxID=1429082 RepID=A0A4R0PI68_9HYPH|nr:ABC transporter permease [Oricola cellulosilytica]TCD16434.1 ABC transporter permease [Oricola cellulosilytica]
MDQSAPLSGTKAATRPARRPFLSPLNQRRWQNFKANRRGYWSLWIFLALFILSMFAEFIANDRPILASYKGELLTPVFRNYSERVLFPDDPLALPRIDFTDPFIQDEIKAEGWMIWPPIRYSYRTVNKEVPTAAPSKPAFLFDGREELCGRYLDGVEDPNCTGGNFNWLGTDDQARDVLARLIYGFRISVLFGLILTAASAVVGVTFGAIQGYFGGWTDLIGQRMIEIWSSMPVLYLLLIIAAILPPGFWILLGIMLLFSWVSFVGIVRAEFLRARNFEYVNAARALGVRNRTIMFRHLLPNAMVATLTFLPFILNGSITTLTALDFLGFGLPPGSASLGELILQGKNNLQAPWLGFSGFIVISLMLSLLIFIGEATRDAFDPRKTFA